MHAHQSTAKLRRRTLACCVLAGLPFSYMQAQEAPPRPPAVGSAATVPTPTVKPSPVQDPDLPQPLQEQEVQALVASPPFTRSINLSESLSLTGIAYVEGKPVATILNRETKESYVVSEEPNAQGWKLAELSASKDLHRAEVKIMSGGELVTVRYGNEQLTPGAKKPGAPAGPGGPGGPPPGPPGGEMRVRTSSYLGEGGRERYYQLSDSARDRFRDLIRQRREQNPNASMEELSVYARQQFEKIEAEDRRNRR